MNQMVQEAEKAYKEATDVEKRKIIQEIEAKALQEDSEVEMEDWGNLIPNLGNTRSRLSLYRQALHVYWVVKRIMAKAMEQVAMELAEEAQGIPNLKKEMKNFQITLLMQDEKLEEIKQLLKMIVPETKAEETLPKNVVD